MPEKKQALVFSGADFGILLCPFFSDNPVCRRNFRRHSVSKKSVYGGLFRQNTFPLLANIGILRAGRAQPLYLLTPVGRFALRATVRRADASLRLLRRGRGNVQGNLAAKGFRIHRTCR